MAWTSDVTNALQETRARIMNTVTLRGRDERIDMLGGKELPYKTL